VDGTVDTAAAGECRVGGIDDHVGFLGGDVAFDRDDAQLVRGEA
jgi:hypothetical protein